MPWKTLDQIDLRGKVALVRVDLNVPVEDGQVTDATRIERVVPTIRAIVSAGGKPVLMAHFGRPKGQAVAEMSLRPVVPALEAVLERRVVFAEDCIGLPAKRVVAALAEGEVALLENTRFHAEEEANDAQFASALAALGDVYVNDAFSAAHRAHASTERIARLLPACAGRAMAAEITALETALERPARPLAAVVGGAKISTKLSLLSNLRAKVDHLVIGGAMANTFLLARGAEVGRSMVEAEMVDTAREVMAGAEKAGCTLHLPEDVVVARELRAGVETETVAADACPSEAMMLDAGPTTVARIESLFDKCRTLVWNGPLGAFETPPFDTATTAAAQKAAAQTEAGRLVTVAGGGDTVAALNRAGVGERFTYVSTAGGAFLEWLEGRTLPGIAALG